MHEQRNELDVAWAAGLFEGEGCWNAYRRKSGKIQISVRLAMTDRDVVEKFAAIVGFGAIHERQHQKHDDWKVLHDWCIYEAEKVRELVALFLPYMGERRRAKALEILELGGDVQPHNRERTHCPQGHPYVGANLIQEVVGTGTEKHLARRCRVCRNTQARDRARRRLGITPDRYRVTE